jgi:hypothetical protein
MVVPNLVTGVTVMLLNQDDDSKTFSFHGRVASFTSICSQDLAVGSADWLYQVYVTETHQRLLNLQSDVAPIAKSINGTSGSSPSVTLLTDLDERDGRGHKTFANQWVIALGEQVPTSGGDKAYLAHTLVVSPTAFTGPWKAIWDDNILKLAQFAKAKSSPHKRLETKEY